jgi:hypothetical protein
MGVWVAVGSDGGEPEGVLVVETGGDERPVEFPVAAGDSVAVPGVGRTAVGVGHTASTRCEAIS